MMLGLKHRLLIVTEVLLEWMTGLKILKICIAIQFAIQFAWQRVMGFAILQGPHQQAA